MNSRVARLLATIVFVPAAVFAQAEPDGQIRELDAGSCWVQGSKDNPAFKIASFNDDATFFIYPDAAIPSVDHRLETKITAKLKELFPSFEKSDYRIHLHCSGAGHQILISVDNPKTPLCLWAKRSADSNMSLDIQSVFPNPDGSLDSACYGVSKASFLFVVKDGEDPTALSEYLGKRYEGIIESQRVSKVLGYIHVTLNKRYAFKETRVREAFLANPAIAEKVRKIELDGIVLTSGESALLFKQTYSGF